MSRKRVREAQQRYPPGARVTLPAGHRHPDRHGEVIEHFPEGLILVRFDGADRPVISTPLSLRPGPASPEAAEQWQLARELTAAPSVPPQATPAPPAVASPVTPSRGVEPSPVEGPTQPAPRAPRERPRLEVCRPPAAASEAPGGSVEGAREQTERPAVEQIAAPVFDPGPGQGGGLRIGSAGRLSPDIIVTQGSHLRGAVLSPDGLYRYSLTRRIGPGVRRLAAVLCNPSTADAEQDDPTLRRLQAFALSWGFATLEVVNLFAWRATDPAALVAAAAQGADVIGPDCDRHLLAAVSRAHGVLAGWGNAGARAAGFPARVAQVSAWLSHYRPWCLGVTRAGHPRHPLYLASDTPRLYFHGGGRTSPRRWKDWTP